MKKLIVAVFVLIGFIAGLALYLFMSVPSKSVRLRFPLTEAQRSLMAEAPVSSEAVALIPTAAALYGGLLDNPVTRVPVRQWAESQKLPQLRWILGGADLAAWRADRRMGCAVRLDPLRALLAKAYFFFASDASTDVQWHGPMLLINSRGGERLGDHAVEELLALASGFSPADALVIQKEESHGAYPPMGRPAVTAVEIDRGQVLLTSRAAGSSQEPSLAPLATAFPRSALLAATFVSPPRVAGDLDRLMSGRVSSLLNGGGSVAIYDIDARKLLPRPHGVIAVPATPERREALAALVSKLTPSFGAGQPDESRRRVGGVDVITRRGPGYTIEYADTGATLLLAFDGTSMALYLKDAFDAPAWPATQWSARLDPQKLVPLLERMGDSPGFRFVTPRLARSVKDLRNWTGALANAKAIEAADSDDGRIEEIRVRIASK